MLDERFAKLCPLWYKRYQDPEDSLYGDKVIGDQIISLGRGECCIAGEAHGFTDAYRYTQSCNTCYSFSFDIIRACMKGKYSKVFEDEINNFTKHFYEVHKKVDTVS